MPEDDEDFVDWARKGVRGLAWQEVVLIVVGVAALVALCFAPAASCSITSTPTSSVESGR